MEIKKHCDLFLANQEFARYLYRDSQPYEEALYALVAGYSDEFGAGSFLLSKSSVVDFEQMSSPSFMLAIFNAFIKISGAKTALEIGTFIGHSTMQIARMVGKSGHVTTIEVFKDFVDIARVNFAQNGLADRITLIEGDATEALPQLPRHSFDLIFIDGNKEKYLDYCRQAEALITNKGIIVVDDAFFHGDALNAVPSTPKGTGCKRLLDHYRSDRRFEKLLLPVRNGILFLFRRRDDQGE